MVSGVRGYSFQAILKQPTTNFQGGPIWSTYVLDEYKH